MVSLNATYPDFNSRMEALNDQLTMALDELAPLTTKRLNTWQTVQWFTDHVINLKRSMRKKEKSGRSTEGMIIGKPLPQTEISTDKLLNEQKYMQGVNNLMTMDMTPKH